MWRRLLDAIGGGLSSLASWFKAKERASAEDAGATKQREKDKDDELKDTREQLDKAIRHRPGSWRDADRF